LKQTTAKTTTTFQQKQKNQTGETNRRHARLITNIPNEQESKKETNPIETSSSNKLFAFEPFDDSIRRFQRLREIRKNLRDKYDDHSQSEQSQTEEIPEPIHIPVERVVPSHPDIIQLSDQTASNVKSNDRRYRSRTLEANQIRAVDNQIYGNMPSKSKQQTQHRSESHKHRANRLSFRRSSDDIHDKQLQYRRHLDGNNSNETWLEIGPEHWTNLLENGWRPTIETPGVNLVSFTDAGKNMIFI
jgi:hypothetical protein